MNVITRAQAEALLQLAEALEACGELGVQLSVPGRSEICLWLGESMESLDLSQHSEVSPTQLRLTVNALVPKHTGS